MNENNIDPPCLTYSLNKLVTKLKYIYNIKFPNLFSIVLLMNDLNDH